MNKNNTQNSHHNIHKVSIDFQEASDFLEEMISINDLVEHVNDRIEHATERWSKLTDKADMIRDALIYSERHRQCRQKHCS